MFETGLPERNYQRGRDRRRDTRVEPQLCAGRGIVDMKWTDTEDIAIALLEKFPDTDPLTVRFTDLHKWVTELDGFTDDPKNSNEKKLEAIQMAWYEEHKEANE